MAFNTVILDMDGTICDSKPGITRSVSYALQHFGINADPENLTMFIGPPLRESFQKYYGFDLEQADQAVRYYRERYDAVGMHELAVYDGIPELLSALHGKGTTLILATSKGENPARQILKNTGLAPLFAFAGGADKAAGRLGKGEVLRYVLGATGLADLDRAVMVGDKEHDVHGAHEVGLRCAAVLYGYGTQRELEDAGADFLMPSVADLGAWLLR